jgi:predicted glutamine amidotransferase
MNKAKTDLPLSVVERFVVCQNISFKNNSHGFGVAVVGKENRIRKELVPFALFGDVPAIMQSSTTIGHTRLATHGDKIGGLQPYQEDGWTFVHNGIVDVPDMDTKYFSDSHAYFKAILTAEGDNMIDKICNATSQLGSNSSYSCFLTNGERHYYWKNGGRQISCYESEDFIYLSTADYDVYFEDATEYQLQNHKIYAWSYTDKWSEEIYENKEPKKPVAVSYNWPRNTHATRGMFDGLDAYYGGTSWNRSHYIDPTPIPPVRGRWSDDWDEPPMGNKELPEVTEYGKDEEEVEETIWIIESCAPFIYDAIMDQFRLEYGLPLPETMSNRQLAELLRKDVVAHETMVRVLEAGQII